MPVDEKALVLIVDDSTLNLKVLGNTLRGEGFSLAVAKSGREALEFVRKKLPDLILLDIMMPEMDGYAVCKRLKSGVVSKNVPVIFLTAKTDTDSIVRGFDAGGVDYVTKPFNTAELLARVRTQIRLKRASDEIKTLRGIIPICSNCKNVRDDRGYWERVEAYVGKHSEAVFSHSICPQCAKILYPDIYDEMYKDEMPDAEEPDSLSTRL
ncbi:MAG TPA: response regulator [Spirochaetes bacterium]|nr:response regulator [Spirochaetota bacterium]